MMLPKHRTMGTLQISQNKPTNGPSIWPCCITAITLTLLLGTQTAHAANAKAEFKRAQNAAAYGSYGDAVRRFHQLLYPPPGRLKGRLRREAHKLLGISYYYLHLRTKKKRFQLKARREFTRLLLLDPKARLNPLLYPPNLIDFYNEVERENRRRLEEILRRRQQKRNAMRVQIVSLQVERQVHSSHPMIALIPFGVPQFVNRQPIKGSLILAGQALALATNITAYAVIYDRQIKDGDQRGRFQASDVPVVKGWQIVQFTALGVFAALVVYGIVDGAIYLRQRRETLLPKLPSVDPREFRSPVAPQSSTYAIPIR